MEKYLGFYRDTVLADVKSENRRVEILDLGGEERFWKACDKLILDTSNITMLNLEDKQLAQPGSFIRSVVGDARAPD